MNAIGFTFLLYLIANIGSDLYYAGKGGYQPKEMTKSALGFLAGLYFLMAIALVALGGLS